MGRKIPGVAHDTPQELAPEVADLLQAVTHRLRREARDILGADGVTPAHMRGLRALGRLAVPARMSDLAGELHIARRSATSLVDELEVRGLVARGHDPLDRRAVTVRVTPAGRRLVAAFGEQRRRTSVGMLAVLSEPELRTLRDLLARVVG